MSFRPGMSDAYANTAPLSMSSMRTASPLQKYHLSSHPTSSLVNSHSDFRSTVNATAEYPVRTHLVRTHNTAYEMNRPNLTRDTGDITRAASMLRVETAHPGVGGTAKSVIKELDQVCVVLEQRMKNAESVANAVASASQNVQVKSIVLTYF